MRYFATAILLFITQSVEADQVRFSDAVKATLIFHDHFDATRQTPHLLKVFLRLENIYDSDVLWVANKVRGIDAELLDSAGDPVPRPGQVVSLGSGESGLVLPYGSHLDWLISHDGGIGFFDDATNKYALLIGSKGWLIPADSVNSYSLRITLPGIPWRDSALPSSDDQPQVLLDIPPTRITLGE